jgi:DNA-nicking Smr family endonuclease
MVQVVMKKRDGTDDSSDEDAFARAMADENVVPLPDGSPRRVRATTPVSLPAISHRSGAARASGGGDEPGEDFAAPGVDRRELRKLKRGDYAPSDRSDLHGMTADAACARVRQFVEASRRHRRRCVCIVHGRGLRSPGGVAVLKGRVRALLESHPAVLAFTDAPRSDGGSGAVYVLLRRQA